MSLSSLSLPPSQSHLSQLNHSIPHFTPSRIRPFQVKCKRYAEAESPKQPSATRRNLMICLTTLSLIEIGLSSPEIAEERKTESDIWQKMKEKLEMLQEIMGVSKRKLSDNEKSSSLPSATEKENVLSPSLPLPLPPQGGKKKLIEAMF